MKRPAHQRWLLPVGVLAVLLLIGGALLSSPPGTQWWIIHEIQRSGGYVSVNPPKPGGWVGAFKVRLPYAFGEVYSVRLADVKARKHWIRAMRDWKRLSSVWLNRSAVDDADLRHLADNKEIYELYLNGNPITEQGLRNLGDKPQLRRLELNWTRVRKLEPIKKQFPRLATLTLRGTPVSDADLIGLADFNALHSIDLSRTHITDIGLKDLARVKGLDYVNLRETSTTQPASSRLRELLDCSFVYARDGSIIVRPQVRRWDRTL